MKPLDYTLYNKVKAKFPPQPFTIIFISLAPENLEELVGIIYTPEDASGLRTIIHNHVNKSIPYAAIGGFSEDDVGYNFSCHEFEQEEDLLAGKIVASSIGSYRRKPVDIEALKRDLQKLGRGLLPSGNT